MPCVCISFTKYYDMISNGALLDFCNECCLLISWNKVKQMFLITHNFDCCHRDFNPFWFLCFPVSLIFFHLFLQFDLQLTFNSQRVKRQRSVKMGWNLCLNSLNQRAATMMTRWSPVRLSCMSHLTKLEHQRPLLTQFNPHFNTFSVCFSKKKQNFLSFITSNSPLFQRYKSEKCSSWFVDFLLPHSFHYFQLSNSNTSWFKYGFSCLCANVCCEPTYLPDIYSPLVIARHMQLCCHHKQSAIRADYPGTCRTTSSRAADRWLTREIMALCACKN